MISRKEASTMPRLLGVVAVTMTSVSVAGIKIWWEEAGFSRPNAKNREIDTKPNDFQPAP